MFTDRSKAVLLSWILFLFCLFRVCHAFNFCSFQPSGPPLGSLVCDVFLCFVTVQCGVLGQLWYLIVSIPDLCLRTYLCFCIKVC